ncbi:MAG: hypothetical protein WAR79_08855, partial [Melioribacteraceae bacterium]
QTTQFIKFFTSGTGGNTPTPSSQCLMMEITNFIIGTYIGGRSNAIRSMYEYIIKSGIELPKSIVHRLQSKLQEEVKVLGGHLLDQLLEAIKILVDKTDKEIVERGSVKKGNRIEGWIDRLDIPVIELGLYNLGNRMK